MSKRLELVREQITDAQQDLIDLNRASTPREAATTLFRISLEGVADALERTALRAIPVIVTDARVGLALLDDHIRAELQNQAGLH